MNTRVAICGYQGDAHQVISLLPYHQRHGWPITLLTPTDSPVHLPGLDCRIGGKRCYIGEDAIRRMQVHLGILLDETSEDFFLIHDADSVLLDPKIPDYLYAEPGVLWSSLVFNSIPEQQPFYPDGMPRVAFHPPWFISRDVIRKLLATDVPFNPDMLLIDYWLVQAAIAAGVPWRGFPASISYPTAEPFWAGAAWDAVRHRGSAFIHSVKTPETADLLNTARRLYLEDQNVRT